MMEHTSLKIEAEAPPQTLDLHHHHFHRPGHDFNMFPVMNSCAIYWTSTLQVIFHNCECEEEH